METDENPTNRQNYGDLFPTDFSLEEDSVAVFMQGFIVVTSTFFTGFYIVQWLRGKCAPEAIYVSIVTMIVYASALLTGKELTWVTIAGGLEVPLGNSLC